MAYDGWQDKILCNKLSCIDGPCKRFAAGWDLYHASNCLLLRISHEAQTSIPLAGEEYLVLDKPLSALTNHLRTSSGVRVLTQWPVVSIDYSKPIIRVRSQYSKTIHCTRVIITVPLKMLQQEDIHFVPRLPTSKQGAIDRLRMSNAIKVHILCLLHFTSW